MNDPIDKIGMSDPIYQIVASLANVLSSFQPSLHRARGHNQHQGDFTDRSRTEQLACHQGESSSPA
jgi:hypothetical protein